MQFTKRAVTAVLGGVILVVAYGMSYPGAREEAHVFARHVVMLPAAVAVASLELENKSPYDAFRAEQSRLAAVQFDGGSALKVMLLPHDSLSATAGAWAALLASRANSFFIRYRDGAIEVYAADFAGYLYGIDLLISSLESAEGMLRFSEVGDYPDHPVRGVHIDLRNLTLAQLNQVIELARRNRRKGAFRQRELRQLAAYARSNGLTVVPEVKLLTKQGRFFKRAHPQLLFNSDTYDPRQPEVYDLVFAYLAELIALLEPPAIHIGHDEVAGIRFVQGLDNAKPVTPILPPELFLQDVERLTQYLSGQGVQVWMWGDMLLQPDSFPEMKVANLHGVEGYGELLGRLPEEVLIVDWHYWDNGIPYRSVDAFAAAGHRVIGASWHRKTTIRDFSRYVAGRPEPGVGMLATTWYLMQRDRWDDVVTLVEASGNAFWYAAGEGAAP